MIKFLKVEMISNWCCLVSSCILKAACCPFYDMFTSIDKVLSDIKMTILRIVSTFTALITEHHALKNVYSC